jgi:hypothetical protein
MAKMKLGLTETEKAQLTVMFNKMFSNIEENKGKVYEVWLRYSMFPEFDFVCDLVKQKGLALGFPEYLPEGFVAFVTSEDSFIGDLFSRHDVISKEPLYLSTVS